MERFISSQPPERQEQLKSIALEIQNTRSMIEGRLSALQTHVSAPSSEFDPAIAAWQNHLCRLAMHGWVEPEDFLRLEGKMNATWPGTSPHPATLAWLPFARWCLGHWGRDGRVLSILAFDPNPELAIELSSGIGVTAVTTSQHDQLLMSMLGKMRANSFSSPPFSVFQSQTGYQEALRVGMGSFQALLLGAAAWQKWISASPVMLQWMLSELASRVFFLAVDSTNQPEERAMNSAGWIRETRSPSNTSWSVWKTTTYGKGSHRIPIHDLHFLRSRVFSEGQFDRLVVASEGMLTISHYNMYQRVNVLHSAGRLISGPKSPSPTPVSESSSLKLESLSWSTHGATHAMLPRLRKSQLDEGMVTLEVPTGSLQRLPASTVETTEEVAFLIADLIDHLCHREALPARLRVSDFIMVNGKIFLTRIGFPGCIGTGDPLDTYLEILSGWNLVCRGTERSFKGMMLPDFRVFPAGFRDPAKLASTSMSWGDFIARSMALGKLSSSVRGRD
jgi:hypothetical protein